MGTINVSEFISEFRQQYSYVQMHLSEDEVAEYLTQDYVRDASRASQMDLLYDYVLSQGLCNVQE